MGSIADAMVRYAQPLIDATDGSQEQVQKALSLSQMCWNLAVTPEAQRDDALVSLQSGLGLDDEELQELKRDIIEPMIRRHQEMFAAMHGPEAGSPFQPVPTHSTVQPAPRRAVKRYPGTGRNERCPCGSGKKYKLCCGR
jgi:preprotein translocase subunit SecA